MRTVESNLLCDGKLNDSVPQYITAHHTSQDVSVDTTGLHLGPNEDGHRIVMHQNNFSNPTLCRLMSTGTEGHLSSESVGGWGEDLLSGSMGGISSISGELTEEDRRLATALMAVQFVGRQHLLHDINNITKVVSERHDVETSTNLIDAPLRLYHQTEEVEQNHIRTSGELSNVDVPSLTGLPPLPPLKRVSDSSMWFHSKSVGYKQAYKEAEEVILNVVNGTDTEIDIDAASSPAQSKQQNKKSLPHKKRISRKLKKNTSNSNRDNLDLQNTSDEIIGENEIVNGDQLNEEQTQLHSIRPVFICQVCGDFYGDDQLKFYQHLKHHYEPHNGTLMIESSLGSMQHTAESIELDKIESSMNHEVVVDNAGPLPESLVELSLENSVSTKMSLYQHHHEKVPLYTNPNDKSIYSIPSNKNLVCTTTSLEDKSTLYQNNLYDDAIQKMSVYRCSQCGKTFKRQRAFENHLKEVHMKNQHEVMNEFSEPEDLMEGIEVVVDNENDEYIQEEINNQDNVTIHHIMSDDDHILPHLTIENGHVHQEHNINLKQWYVKNMGDVTSNALPVNSHTNNSAMGGTMDNEVQDLEDNEFACPLCGEILLGRGAYSQHAQHCHINVKEDVLQRMMEVEVEVSSGGTAGDELASEINDNSNHTVPEPDTSRDLEIITSKEDLKSNESKSKDSNKKILKKCEDCGREFTHRNSLIYHMLSHSGTRPYECKECGKGFFAKSALKVHTRLHSGLKPYKCVDCGRSFRQWGDLRYHVISLHSNQKLHKCDYCNKEFARKYSLIVHRRIHTGEKNYICEFCNKTFRASSYLQNHRRIHTGEKPYPCNICGKMFRVRGDMRRHLITHDKYPLQVEEKKKTEKQTKQSMRGEEALKVSRIKQEQAADKSADNSAPSSGGNFLEITKHDLDQEAPSKVVANSNLIVKTHIESASGVHHHMSTVDPLDPNGALYVWPIFMS